VHCLESFLTTGEIHNRTEKFKGHPIEADDVLLDRKAPTAGFMEVLLPVKMTHDRPNFSVPVQRYRIRDLQSTAKSYDEVILYLKDQLLEKESEYSELVKKKVQLVAQCTQEEGIRREAENSANMMQSQIYSLNQGLQDLNGQDSDLKVHMKQLAMELKLLELTIQSRSDGTEDAMAAQIQSILNEMKDEIKHGESDLVALREVNEKLRKEAEQEEMRRLKYEQELVQLEKRLKEETTGTHYDDDDAAYDPRIDDNKIFGFSAPTTAQSLKWSGRISSQINNNTSSTSSEESWQ